MTNPAGAPGALVEKVEEAIRNVWFRTPGDPAHPAFQREARAAISIVVEECAKVAEEKEFDSDGLGGWQYVYDDDGPDIAAAIRALDSREG